MFVTAQNVNDNLWTHSAQPWITCGEEMLNYEGQPTLNEFSQLFEKFSNMAQQYNNAVTAD
jgi:hypothetical protein